MIKICTIYLELLVSITHSCYVLYNFQYALPDKTELSKCGNTLPEIAYLSHILSLDWTSVIFKIWDFLFIVFLGNHVFFVLSILTNCSKNQIQTDQHCVIIGKLISEKNHASFIKRNLLNIRLKTQGERTQWLLFIEKNQFVWCSHFVCRNVNMHKFHKS